MGSEPETECGEVRIMHECTRMAEAPSWRTSSLAGSLWRPIGWTGWTLALGRREREDGGRMRWKAVSAQALGWCKSRPGLFEVFDRLHFTICREETSEKITDVGQIHHH